MASTRSDGRPREYGLPRPVQVVSTTTGGLGPTRRRKRRARIPYKRRLSSRTARRRRPSQFSAVTSLCRGSPTVGGGRNRRLSPDGAYGSCRNCGRANGHAPTVPWTPANGRRRPQASTGRASHVLNELTKKGYHSSTWRCLGCKDSCPENGPTDGVHLRPRVGAATTIWPFPIWLSEWQR